MAAKLTDHSSVDKVVSEMTVEEKARMVIGGAPFHTEAMPEYGIPAMYMLDSCNGLNSMEYSGEQIYQKLAADAEAAGQPLDREKNSYMGGLLIALGTLKKLAAEQAASGVAPAPKEYGCYPPGIALGSTWDPEVVEECGRALAKEMGSYGIDMILGPNVNIHRDPLCGRLGESFTEDPYLMTQLAPAMVKGIQEEGLVACVKHGILPQTGSRWWVFQRAGTWLPVPPLWQRESPRRLSWSMPAFCGMSPICASPICHAPTSLWTAIPAPVSLLPPGIPPAVIL